MVLSCQYTNDKTEKSFRFTFKKFSKINPQKCIFYIISVYKKN